MTAVRLEQAMEAAWDHVRTRLFRPETRLFYDYLTDADPALRFKHLPWPEEIARQFPNPCGWGTGMEDSMLNAGSVMEILAQRHALAGDPGAPAFAEQVLEGMAACATVHGVPGFVVRSLSPRDGTSCYFNSSRDQFTLFVYGVWRYWRGFGGGTSAGGRKARELLEAVARYCEETVVRRGGTDLRRLDGGPAVVSGVVDVEVHERMRLPMFFAAAWDATGDAHWQTLYRRYALAGIESNLRLDETLPWWDIGFSQMQLSLALLAEVEAEGTLRASLREAMRRTARLARRFFEPVLALALDRPGDWSELNEPWRTLPMYLREDASDGPLASAVVLGYPYLNPRFPEPFRESQRWLQAAGNYFFTLALSPDPEPMAATAERFAELARRPDYARNGSDGPVKLLHGYWLARARNGIDMTR